MAIKNIATIGLAILISVSADARTCGIFTRSASLEEVNDRMRIPLTNLKRVLKDIPVNITSLRSGLLKSDARGHLFKLEGLLRLYKDRDVEGAEKLHVKVKELEDALGKYDANANFVAWAEKLEAPEHALNDARSRRDESLVEVNELLKKWFLVEDAYYNKFVEKVAELEEPKNKKMLKAFRKDVEGFLEDKLDLNNLQEGIHEYRRRVRWIPIYVEGLGDLFHVGSDGRVKKVYRGVKVTGKEDSSIEIPERLLLETSNFISDIGKIKDEAEPIEFLAQSYVNAGLARNFHQAETMIHEQMKKQGQKVPDTIPRAKKLIKDFESRKIYERWIDILRGDFG